MTEAVWSTESVLGLGFAYPAITPQGHSVEFDEVRLHARSIGSTEVYFELSRYAGISPEAFYRRDRDFASGHGRSVTDLTATVFNGEPAQTFTISWDDSERVFLLVERSGYVYRFVRDPRSPINDEIIGSITLP